MSIPTKTTPNPYKEIAEIKNGMFQFNFTVCQNWMESLGKNTFGNHFKLFPEDFALIYSLIVYAIEDKIEAEKRRLDLKKGILLSRKVLADLAMNHPDAFEAVVKAVK